MGAVIQSRREARLRHVLKLDAPRLSLSRAIVAARKPALVSIDSTEAVAREQEAWKDIENSNFADPESVFDMSIFREKRSATGQLVNSITKQERKSA